MWTLSGGAVDRVLLMEFLFGAPAVRAHFVQPGIRDTTVRRPGWSVYCYPANLVDENHTLWDEQRLAERLPEDVRLGLDFLARWDTPKDVVQQNLLSMEAPDRQAVLPIPGNAWATASAVVWAIASGDANLLRNAEQAWSAVPLDRFGREVRDSMEAGITRLRQSAGR